MHTIEIIHQINPEYLREFVITLFLRHYTWINPLYDIACTIFAGNLGRTQTRSQLLIEMGTQFTYHPYPGWKRSSPPFRTWSHTSNHISAKWVQDSDTPIQNPSTVSQRKPRSITPLLEVETGALCKFFFGLQAQESPKNCAKLFG